MIRVTISLLSLWLVSASVVVHSIDSPLLTHGAASTAHPLATLAADEVYRRGGCRLTGALCRRANHEWSRW